ncbi:MAG TPA: universal stress protein, partial [Polyangiaceae bacterium]|nr:universal stress protein [Polyangiaceae bacterium]
TALIAEEAAEAHIPISAQVQAGYVAQSLLERLKHGNYDLVVMGTHGRTGLSHLLLGSVAERVVRLAPCPVLTIRVPMHREKELSIARAERERHAHDTDTPTRN